MENVNFVLLRLPFIALRNVLKSMEIFDLMSLSLCSHKAKHLVKLLNIASTRTIVKARWNVVLCIRFKETDIDFLLEFPDEVSVMPENCIASSKMENGNKDVRYWYKTDFNFRTWIQHFLSVVHREFIDEVQFSNIISLPAIKRSLDNFEVNSILVENFTDVASAREMLSSFPNIRSYQLTKNPYETDAELRQFLMRNHFSLTLTQDFGLSVNDVLSANCVHIRLDSSNWTMMELNMLLKQWQSGGPFKLASLSINLQRSDMRLDKDVILGGVCYKPFPEDDIKQFVLRAAQNLFDTPTVVYVKKGYNLWNQAGICATIDFDVNYHFARFFVWS